MRFFYLFFFASDLTNNVFQKTESNSKYVVKGCWTAEVVSFASQIKDLHPARPVIY